MRDDSISERRNTLIIFLMGSGAAQGKNKATIFFSRIKLYLIYNIVDPKSCKCVGHFERRKNEYKDMLGRINNYYLVKDGVLRHKNQAENFYVG